MGRSKKVFGKSQKRPNGDIRSLLFKKKRTAEAALDALGASSLPKRRRRRSMTRNSHAARTARATPTCWAS